ncbi:MAG: hypothetical protein F6K56_08225 [Moorea sp. SIO3G5]|nr:hypothetical protein [Moorena sp. SIO3G5]
MSILVELASSQLQSSGGQDAHSTAISRLPTPDSRLPTSYSLFPVPRSLYY